MVEVCRQHGEQTYYRWKKQLGDINSAELKELRQLRKEIEQGLIHVRRSRHLWEYGDTKTEGARGSVQLFPLTVGLLRTLQPLRVTPEMPVFVNTLVAALEPNSLLPHWDACQRALGIRVRGLYCTDTFVTTALYRMRETNQITSRGSSDRRACSTRR